MHILGSQMATIEEKLGFESSEVRFENITSGDLKIAAEIFVYLRTCPGTDEGLRTYFRSSHINTQ